jgi:hypothetical protein
MAFLAALASQALAAEALVVADFLALFPSATTNHALVCQLQSPARCGTVTRNAIYQHPLDTNQPARTEYTLSLPRVARGELLLLHFAIGIADGVRFEHGEDGVRFGIEVNRLPVFSVSWRQCRWLDQVVDLTDYSGRKIELAFLADAIENPNHDWSVWGAPRLLHFRGAPLSGPDEPALPYGMVAVRLKPDSGLTLRLQSLDPTHEKFWALTNRTLGSALPSWHVFDYEFPEATKVMLSWIPLDAAEAVWLNALPAEPVLLRLASAQAVITPGSQRQIRAVVRNQGRGYLAQNAAILNLTAQEGETLPALSVPALRPDEEAALEWTWQAPAEPGFYNLQAQLISTTGAPLQELSTSFEVLRSPAPEQSSASRNLTLANRHMKIELVRSAQGYCLATLWTWQRDHWVQVGVWRPLMQVVLDTPTGEKQWEIRPHAFNRGRTEDGSQPNDSLHYQSVVTDPEQTDWAVALRIELDPDRPTARIHYMWQPSAPRQVKALWGPNFYAGDGTSGSAKTWALFPGLEFLYGSERSSSPRDFHPPLDDRRTPHPWKITLPLMAISTSPGQSPSPFTADRFFCPDSLKDARPSPPALDDEVTLGLFWNPLQSWDDANLFPSARFSSPNHDEGMDNHRLGLFLPNVPQFVPENADRARNSWHLDSGQIIKLDASLVAASGPAMVALREYYAAMGGFPRPNPWPRSWDEELAVCRAGFLKTTWDDAAKKWRHCIDWPSEHTPGFATLLWQDALVAPDSAGRWESRERVELVAKTMLQESGPAIFVSEANCHIMRWEFPFYYGYLQESLLALEPKIRELAGRQRPEGGWLFKPAKEEQMDLGKVGDSVLGTSARHAADLLRYARITGDDASRQSGEKALTFMEMFRVPRGGQTWECPLYQPDLLAAAWAAAAYMEGYRISGNPRWLQLAVYWAETGLPFIYHWSLADHPMMLGATLPVFGSSFYTHSWLATPVQWCGLVYACHLQNLADHLEESPQTSHVATHPVLLNLAPADWRRIAETITVSAMHQQIDYGDRVGTYPDSISDFKKLNPAFLNPEDILINVLKLRGHDPDVKTVRLTGGGHGPVVISSGAWIQQAEIKDSTLVLDLRYFAGETSHTLISGLNTKTIQHENQVLSLSPNPLKNSGGWHFDAQRRWTFLGIPHTGETARVEVRWLD